MIDIPSINSAKTLHNLVKQSQQQQETLSDIMENIAEDGQRFRDLQSAGAKANIESRDQLIEQNKLLRKQLTEQTEINQRLEYEFKMGAREAVITRKIAYWSLGVGIAGVVVAIVAIFVGVWV